MYSTNGKGENEGGSAKSTAHRQSVRPRDKHVKQLMQLKQRQKIIEKSLSSFIDNLKVHSPIVQSISLDFTSITIKREQVFQCLVTNVRDVVNELKAVQSTLLNLTKIQELDVNGYKKKLVHLSEAIQDLKNSLSLEALSKEEILLDTELRGVFIQFERYDSSEKSKTSRVALSSCTTGTIDGNDIATYQEMDEFHKLLLKTGHTENWTDEDHSLFLRTRRKCKTIPALVIAIQRKCPDLSAETIINHEAWYKMYLSLRDGQRRKVNEWQIQRKADKSTKKKFECGDRLETTDEVHSANMKSNNRTISNSGMKKTVLIERWRADRKNKSFADDEQVRSHLESKRVNEEKRRRSRQKKIQETLREYREKKQLTATSGEPKRQENRNDKSREDDRLMLAFRQQDRDYVKRKVELIVRARRSTQAFSKPMIRRKPINLESSTTLFNATKVWSQKCKRACWPKTINSLYIKDIPKNSIRWRNEESVELNT